MKEKTISLRKIQPKHKEYQILEHTADVRVRVEGRNLKDLFINAAVALFDILVEEKELTPEPKQRVVIQLQAEDVEELFVNWLNELLSLSYAKNLIFLDYHISSIDAQSIKAAATGVNSSCFKFKTEIKAVTYHELKINKTRNGWQAEVIFDV